MRGLRVKANMGSHTGADERTWWACWGHGGPGPEPVMLAACRRRKSVPHTLSKRAFLSASFFVVFWPCRVTCGISVSRPGIEPRPPALGAQSLNHWTTREALYLHLKGAFRLFPSELPSPVGG